MSDSTSGKATKDETCLGQTSITSNNVQQAFRELLKNEQINLVKADAEVIAAGQGFTSYILRLSLIWSEEDKKKHQSALPKSAILKALSKEAIEKLFDSFKLEDVEKGRQDFAHMFNMSHKTECFMYQLFGDDKSASPVPMARAYATWLGDGDHPPMILLEDLGDRARVLGDGSASLTYAQMLSIAELMASLHVWSMTTEDGWRDKLDTFADRLVIFAAFMPMMKQAVQKCKEAFPEAFGNLDDAKLMTLFDPATMLKMHNTHKPWMPDVLVHGDFWANNIMFKKLPDGSMGDQVAAYIDWQMSFIGNPMIDFGRVLSMSFSSDLRKAHLEDIIKRYYDCLTTKLGKDRVPKEMTFELILKVAKEQTALNCLMMFFMQDTMQSLFAPPDGPEAEIKRERMIKTAKAGFEYAAEILDITVASDK